MTPDPDDEFDNLLGCGQTTLIYLACLALIITAVTFYIRGW